MNTCYFCENDDGLVVFRSEALRVIHAREPGFPAFYRVIWNAHVTEFSDLSVAERQTCMEAVVVVEQALRKVLHPVKMNLATLGNMVPHVHWHVIARFDWDTHFPAPVWAEARRESDSAKEAVVAAACLEVNRQIAAAMAA